MGRYDKGHAAYCDVCGFRYQNTELRKRWDNLWVCSQDWEPEHPLDMQHTMPVTRPVAWARPDSTTTQRTVTRVLVADTGVAGDAAAPN